MEPNRIYPLLVAALAVALPSCAVLDPYNIIGRSVAHSQPEAVPVPSKDDSWRQAALDAVWHTINDRYYDPGLNGVDWQAARARHAPLLAAASDEDYWDALDKMAGELKDSHTRVESPRQKQQRLERESHSLGIGFLELDGELVLTSVHPDSDANYAGARPGMRIKRIDGRPALEAYRELVATSRDTSTPWARTRGALRKISSGTPGSKLTMTFLRSDGSEIAATLARRRFSTAPTMSHRTLPSGFGYVRFSGFDEALRGRVLAAVDSLKDTPGLILDLRNNGGGSGAFAAALLSKFFEQDQKGMKVLTRTGKPVSLFFVDLIKNDPVLKGSGRAAYTRPLVILVNEGSASASEVVSATAQDLGRAAVIGERTCGCLLGFLGYADLPGGGQLAYSEIGYITSKGRRIEGAGVVPDVEVKLGVEDYLLNRDRALEAAEAFLGRALAANELK
jgi:carboxyl-terminal processing protease